MANNHISLNYHNLLLRLNLKSKIWKACYVYLNDIDVPVDARVWLSAVMWRHRLADDVVQVKTVWFQTFLLLLMETLQIVDCCTCPTGTTINTVFGLLDWNLVCKVLTYIHHIFCSLLTSVLWSLLLLISESLWDRAGLEINAVYCERIYTVVLVNKFVRTENACLSVLTVVSAVQCQRRLPCWWGWEGSAGGDCGNVEGWCLPEQERDRWRNNKICI